MLGKGSVGRVPPTYKTVEMAFPPHHGISCQSLVINGSSPRYAPLEMTHSIAICLWPCVRTDYPMPIMLTTGEAWMIRTSVTVGSGQRVIAAGCDQMGKDACHVAITWACINAARLRKWFDVGPSHAGQLLFTKKQDVTITSPAVDVRRSGPSLGAAASLSLVSWMLGGRRRFREEHVGVTGAIDLRGRVLQVADLKQKSVWGMKGGIGMLIFPSDNMAMLERDDFADLECEDHPGLREYVKAKAQGASSMLDVMSLAMEGR